MMTGKTTLAFVAALTVALIITAPRGAEAQPSKDGSAGVPMSTKGRGNTNAQWSADPEKGWIRADERHRLKNAKQADSKDTRGKRKGNGAKKTF